MVPEMQAQKKNNKLIACCCSRIEDCNLLYTPFPDFMNDRFFNFLILFDFLFAIWGIFFLFCCATCYRIMQFCRNILYHGIYLAQIEILLLQISLLQNISLEWQENSQRIFSIKRYWQRTEILMSLLAGNILKCDLNWCTRVSFCSFYPFSASSNAPRNSPSTNYHFVGY